ncbi:MAG TPA: SDR family oxidoreductase [Gemmataceae bacterium]|jgi:NAD(P)-dependent dehydrogenase (short-subunit alcohol dehydrogenase family)|nr:SDR family oxidoreductase [Gemmataceae bacterium]
MAVQNNPAWLAAAGAGAAWLAYRTYRARHRYDLHGKTVLITGGSRGLGLILARQFAAEGARIGICARDADELDRAFEDLAGRGAHVVTVPCDLTSPSRVEEMVAVVQQRLGPIDVLVNNAGIIQVGPIESMRDTDFYAAMAGNFFSALHTTLAVLPTMRRRGGRIVNITSIGGKISVPHLLPYSASKFAMVGFSEGLRAELRKDGIVVTTVCPGLMRTGSVGHADVKGQFRKEHGWFTLGDSLPVASMAAERAGRQIVRACRRGDAEIVLGWPFKLAALAHGVAPGLVSDLMGVTNYGLPGPGGIGSSTVKGRDIRHPLLPAWVTALNDRAAERNNEVRPGERASAGRAVPATS